MRKYFFPLLMILLITLSSGPSVMARDIDRSETQAVIERAHHLKDLLDKLLSESNHSSIQETLHNGSNSGDPQLEEALRLKSSGEQFLEDEEYMKAAVTLQAALDQVFEAVRAQDNGADSADASSARLTEAITANDTFISAATRVVNGDPDSKALELLESAREARAKADASADSGDTDTALQELEISTQLAQQAIMTVRNGKVIERRP